MLPPRGFTVAHLRPGEGIAVVCAGCRRQRAFTRENLIALFGAGTGLDGIGLRLRCDACGERPSEAWLTWPHVWPDKAPRESG